MTPGDLVLVPHGGERIGKLLAQYERDLPPGMALVRVWRSSRRKWSDTQRGYRVEEIEPAPSTDRRARQANGKDPTP